MQSLQLHRHLTQQFTEIGLKATPNARKNLAFLCQTLAFSPNCHLATLALGVPLPGRRENLIQHRRRTLQNQQLRSAECYQPLVRYLFAQWPDHEVNLVMDRTDLASDLSILTLGVAHQKRLVPLTWNILPFGGTSADEYNQIMETTPISRVMSRELVTLAPGQSMREAAEIMYGKRIGCLPVVEGGELTGLVTTTDMLGLLIQIMRDKDL